LLRLSCVSTTDEGASTTFLARGIGGHGAGHEASRVKYDECRRLTFLYCDVVNSTAIAQRLDAEDWRAMLGDFQGICARIVEANGGAIHDNPGDGLLAYFGFPAHRENSAVDAVRAGLRIADGRGGHFDDIDRMLDLARLAPLGVRIGVHTGSVVLGRLNGRITATGIPLHFAERLQGQAAPNTVLVSEATRHLVAAGFELTDLGPRTLKGFDDPAPCFRAEREIARPASGGTPFVGRQAELDILRTAWRDVRTGPPSAVLIAGEAGIGKSRLIRQFNEGPLSDGATVLRWNGAEDTRHSSLHPIVQQLQQALPELAAGDAGQAVAALVSMLPASLDRARLIPILGWLLSVTVGPPFPPLEGTAKGLREVVQAALADWLVHESRRRPLLLVLEDVRWMDPSTLEVVTRVARATGAGPLLLLMSCRTETSETWSCPFATRVLSLGRLPADAARSMVRASPGAAHLSDALVRQLIERTDGIPLFIEESVTMAIDTAALGTVEENQVREGASPPIVPARLTDLLVERLDRVGDARETAGIAAAIGREFTHSLLRSISAVKGDALEEQLDVLLRSGLVHLVDTAAERSFSFKHALVRDAAYATLVKSRRRASHARIAKALATLRDAGGRVRPEQLAHHYTEAGLPADAIEAWLDAGRLARRRSEQAEAIEHYRRVPDLLDSLPRDTPYPVLHRRLTTHLSLAACHVALDGYSSEEARRLYESAETLADRLGQAEQIFNARLGLETYFHMRGEFDRAMRLARSCRDMAIRAHRRRAGEDASAQRDSDKMALAKSNWAIGAIHFHRGEFDRAMTHLARCLRYCESVAAERRSALQDPVVMCRVYRSWHAWERGRADDALRSVEDTVAHAEGSTQAFSLGVALAFNACIRLFRREYEQTIERASRCMAICERAGFRTWLAWAMIIRGRARCENPADRRGGFADLEEGLRIWNDVGAIVTRPFSETLLAEAYLLDGQVDKALASVRGALATIERHGERYYEPEIHRVHALALLRSAREADGASSLAEGRVAQAEASLRRAIDIAAARGMTSSVLRSNIDLARLHRDTRRANGAPERQATNELEAAVAGIEQAENNIDVGQARELLRALQERRASPSIAR